MFRRVAVTTAGLAILASLGLTGAGTASAAIPALNIKPGSTWLAEPKPGGCELEIFSASGTFASESKDAGKWSGGGATISMKWTRGANKGLAFDGTFAQTVHGDPEYQGRFSIEGYVFKGELVKGTRC